MSLVYQRGNAKVRANLTPMIDVTFLLIVFFVLVSQIVEVENEEMELPAPMEAASGRMGDEQRAVINVLPEVGSGRARGYRLGGHFFEVGEAGARDLAEHLAGLYEKNPQLSVNLRADQATEYRWIEPVMRAVGRAARQTERAGAPGVSGVVPRVNLVVVREEG